MYLTWGFIMAAVPFILLAILISTASYTDFKEAKIPNKLTLPIILLAFIYHGSGGWHSLWHAVLGCMTGMGVMLILYVFKAIGAGDVKLFGAIGTVMGWPFTLDCMMYSVIIAGMIGLLILIFRHRLVSTLKRMFSFLLWSIFRRKLSIVDYTKQNQVLTFPFMYAVMPAVIITIIVREVMEVV